MTQPDDISRFWRLEEEMVARRKRSKVLVKPQISLPHLKMPPEGPPRFNVSRMLQLGRDGERFRELEDLIRRAIRFSGCPYDLREDFAQEVWSKILEKFRDEPDPANSIPWEEVKRYLWQVARNKAVDLLRGMRRRKTDPLPEEVASPGGVNTDDRLDLLAFIDRLSARQREVMRMLIDENLTRAEIAERLSIALNTVNHILLDAKANLSQYATTQRVRKDSKKES